MPETPRGGGSGWPHCSLVERSWTRELRVTAWVSIPCFGIIRALSHNDQNFRFRNVQLMKVMNQIISIEDERSQPECMSKLVRLWVMLFFVHLNLCLIASRRFRSWQNILPPTHDTRTRLGVRSWSLLYSQRCTPSRRPLATVALRRWKSPVHGSTLWPSNRYSNKTAGGCALEWFSDLHGYVIEQNFLVLLRSMLTWRAFILISAGGWNYRLDFKID